MANNITFVMITPDAIRANYVGPILAMITEAGFRIKAMKYTQLSKQIACQFYAVHKERPFYDELVESMSHPIVVAILEKDNAVEDFRKLIGSNTPTETENETIRKKYASRIGENAIYGSDSEENAQIESNFFFNNLEIF